MKVKELIKLLENFDQNLEVVYECHSEHRAMIPTDITTIMGQPMRPDGWVPDKWGTRDDKDLATVKYLSFPGN